MRIGEQKQIMFFHYQTHLIMLTKIYGPFTDEEVEAIKKYQSRGDYHPFTCCSFDGCDKDQNDGGVLIPNNTWLVCPCGKYKQRWIWKEMIDVGKS